MCIRMNPRVAAGDKKMGGEGHISGAHGPDVEIMDRFHTGLLDRKARTSAGSMPAGTALETWRDFRAEGPRCSKR